MLRLASFLARLAFAACVSLLALAVARWAPFHAEPPLDVRALPLAGPAVLLGVAAALLGRERRPSRWRPVAAGAAVAAFALLGVVAQRGPAGLGADVSGREGGLGRTAPDAIQITGRDLPPEASGARFQTLRWAGALRVPEPGLYRLWVKGRGRATVALDGHLLIDSEGDPLAGEAALALAAGEQRLEVTLEHRGPGPRLVLGWTRPGGRDEPIPPRYLGAPRSRWTWGAIDALALLTALLAGAAAFLGPWDRPRVPPSPRPVTAAEVGASLLGYAILLAIMSWPLARDLARTGPMERPDGRLNAWILAWAGPTALTAPGRVFDAPVFHPLPDALAFSENLLLPAVVVAPLQPLGGPVLAYNVALLLALALSGLGTQLLVRRASGDRLAAFVAGAFFAAGPHRWTRLSHLHAQLTVFLPFALLALDRFWERRSLRRAMGVGLMLALQGLASIYLGVITATTLAVAVIVGVLGGLRPRELLRLAVAFAGAGLVLWPVVEPYLRMRAFQGVEFTMETVSIYAANLPSYAAAGTALWGPVSQRLLDPALTRDTLFPGLTVLVLGVVGLGAAPRRFVAVALAASATAVVLSLGPETGLYRFLHEHVVFLRGVRALARFALVPTLALAVLAGLALASRRRLVVLGALGLMMLEAHNLPLRLSREDGPPPAAGWLAGKEGAVLQLPLAADDTRVMLDGLAHGRPLLNGDSGFIPRPFDRAMELLQGPVGLEGRRFLRAVDVRHVVSPDGLIAGVPEVARFGDLAVYELSGEGPRATDVAPGDPVGTRWGERDISIVLPEPRRVGRVVFEVSDAAWRDRPRVEASRDGLSWEVVPAEASLADATLSLYRDPRHARGEVRFAPREARFLRIERALPARPGALEVGP